MNFLKKLFGGREDKQMNFGIYNYLGEEVQGMSQMKDAIAQWDRLYKNNADWIYGDTKSLNLAAGIASELARLVTMEMKVRFNSGAECVKSSFDEVMADIRRYTEYACAKGGLVFKPYVKDGEIFVDYVQADKFYPIQYDARGHIIGAIFIEQVKQGGYIYTRLERHKFVGDIYLIENEVYKSKTGGVIGKRVGLAEVENWKDLSEKCEIANLKKPLFAYFKMPSANTIDVNSPLGVSVYARAVDLICEADKQYSRLLWEFESGERALYLDSAAYRRDEKGRLILPDKRLYRSADTGVDGLFEDWSPEFREQSILNGLNSILVKIEDVCGLARGTFSNVESEAKTATELRILRQRSYATVADIQKALEVSLRDLIYAMSVWGSLYGLMKFGECEVGFEFDDSIVADRAREFDEREKLFGMGIISAEEFRAWYLGESEKVCRNKLKNGGHKNED